MFRRFVLLFCLVLVCIGSTSCQLLFGKDEVRVEKVFFDDCLYTTTEAKAANNDNDMIDPGEIIFIDMALYAGGFLGADDVNVRVSSPSKDVKIIKDSADYGTIASDSYKTYYDGIYSYSYNQQGTKNLSEVKAYFDYEKYIPFIIQVSRKCKRGSEITLNVDISTSKKEYTDQVKLQIRPQGDVDEKYWGKWLCMDAYKKDIYIDSYGIYEYDNYYGKSDNLTQDNVSGFKLESDSVLKNGNIVYFREGGSRRGFTAGISGFENTLASVRAAGINDDLEGVRINNENECDCEVVKYDESTCTIEFEGGIGGDEQTVIVSDEECTCSVEIEVTPSYDGENIGTIPLVEENSYAFKTTCKVTDSSGKAKDILFCNDKEYYTVTIDMKNVGTEDCGAAAYTISADDANLELKAVDSLSGIISTVEPGVSKSIKIKAKYNGTIRDEYIDVPVNITIKDRYGVGTWNDSVHLRFYKGYTTLKIAAASTGNSYGSQLKGFLIYPDGRSKYVIVNSNNTNTIQIPWSKKDYILAFSGASADTEMMYSFAFTQVTSPDDLSSFNEGELIEVLMRYTKNTSTNPYPTDNFKAVTGYCGKGDIQFFRINNSDLSVE